MGKKTGIRHKWLFIFLLILCLPPLRAAAAGKDDRCLSCHEGRAAGGRGGEKPATRPMKTGLRDSVHRALACTECHRDAGATPTHKVPLEKVDCAGCHEEAGRLFGRSVHGAALKRGDKDAPSCSSCHGDHYVLGRIRSAVAGLEGQSHHPLRQVPHGCGGAEDAQPAFDGGHKGL